jgi:Kdo2-lipid IVA lauroyltransferase/acyltransferase
MIAILGYWLADGLVRWLPAPLIDRIGILAARVTFALRPPARRAQEANMARLLGAGNGARVDRAARESFEHFALAFADFLRLGGPQDRLERDLVVHGREHLAAARASGRGVILVSAHLGS